MGIAHGMVNNNIGEVVANGMLTIFGHTLKDLYLPSDGSIMWPRKAVQGWQAEVVKIVSETSGRVGPVYVVTEIR